MLFLHPETSSFKKCISIVISPRHIFFFKRMPQLIPLHRICHFLSVNLMLKFIHAGHIRNDSESLLKMCPSILISFFFKEIFHPGVGKIFHRHRMDLCNLRSRKCNFIRYTASGSCISFKCMSCLMGQNIYIR